MGYQESYVHINKYDVEDNNKGIEALINIFKKYDIRCKGDSLAECIGKLHFKKSIDGYTKGMDVLIISGERQSQREELRLVDIYPEDGDKVEDFFTKEEIDIIKRIKIEFIDYHTEVLQIAESDSNKITLERLELMPKMEKGYDKFNTMLTYFLKILNEKYGDPFEYEANSKNELESLIENTFKNYGYSFDTKISEYNNNNVHNIINEYLINGTVVYALTEVGHRDGKISFIPMSPNSGASRAAYKKIMQNKGEKDNMYFIGGYYDNKIIKKYDNEDLMILKNPMIYTLDEVLELAFVENVKDEIENFDNLTLEEKKKNIIKYTEYDELVRLEAFENKEDAEKYLKDHIDEINEVNRLINSGYLTFTGQIEDGEGYYKDVYEHFEERDIENYIINSVKVGDTLSLDELIDKVTNEYDGLLSADDSNRLYMDNKSVPFGLEKIYPTSHFEGWNVRFEILDIDEKLIEITDIQGM